MTEKPSKEEIKRVIINMPISLYEKIKTKAEEENRSISNYVVTEIKKILE